MFARALALCAVVMAAVLGGAGPVQAAPGPEAARKPPPRCVVIPSNVHPTRGGKTPASSATRDYQSIVVVVPKLRCQGRNPQEPGGDGNGQGDGDGQGNGHGNGQGNGDGDGGGKGHIPFTGFDALTAMQIAVALCGSGLVLVRLGRRRPAAGPVSVA